MKNNSQEVFFFLGHNSEEVKSEEKDESRKRSRKKNESYTLRQGELGPLGLFWGSDPLHFILFSSLSYLSRSHLDPKEIKGRSDQKKSCYQKMNKGFLYG